MKIKCMIVDDEPIARKGIQEYIHEIDFLETVAVCDDALQANAILNTTPVDLLFLDIQMPKLTGIDFLKSLANPPAVIFTTAYQEYALEGYELAVMDYLVKPILFNRFLKAVNKARDYIELKQNTNTPNNADYFFLKVDNKFEKILYSDVLFVEALQNYVAVHTAEKKMLSYITLTSIESQLPSAQFVKIHKSYLVAVSKINAVEGNMIIIGKHQLPISRVLKDEVMQRVVENKLMKR